VPLAGGRRQQLQRFLARFLLLPTEGLAGYEAAAALYRSCRRAGETPRALTDCLVAAVAVRTGAALLQLDRDFTILARHTGLRLSG
jgi:predicted nucleic acid-binding protein